MDWNRLLTMVTQMFIRTAVDKGIDYAARRGKSDAELTPEERKQAEQGRALGQRAKEIAKVTRRFMR